MFFKFTKADCRTRRTFSSHSALPIILCGGSLMAWLHATVDVRLTSVWKELTFVRSEQTPFWFRLTSVRDRLTSIRYGLTSVWLNWCLFVPDWLQSGLDWHLSGSDWLLFATDWCQFGTDWLQFVVKNSHFKVKTVENGNFWRFYRGASHPPEPDCSSSYGVFTYYGILQANRKLLKILGQNPK